jgi:glucuronoarabinoxylan endo-1,4-beta-xylanase
MKTKLKFPVLLGILLVFGFLFFGCPTEGETNNTGGTTDETTGKSATPAITAQPASRFYEIGGTVPTLTVTVQAGEGGTLTYQWYKADSPGGGGTLVEGATAATYQPTDTEAGTYYYYVIVTNTEPKKEPSEKASARAAIKIVASVEEAFNTSGRTFTFDPATEYQYVRGFGGMSNVWTSPDMTVKDIDTLYSPDSLGMNMFRICVYPYMDALEDGTEAGDPEVGNQRTHADYYNMVKRVNQYGGYVLASPWTPPAEYKDPPQREDGRLKKEFYDEYAQHLRDFCQRMKDRGAPIYAISIQNEPNWEGGYDGCRWDPEDMRDFFKQVGHFTTVPTTISGYGGGKATEYVLTMNGESANTPSINDAALNDTVSAAAIDLIGRHIYGERTTKYTKGLDMGYEVWMTEINTNSGNAASYPQDSTWPFVWTFINDVHNCINNNDESAFIHWYSKRFYGLIGDGQYGTENGVPTYRGWALAQFAKFANNTKRIGVTASEGVSINTSTAIDSALKVTAYKSVDNDNSLSMVILNPTDSAIGDVEIKLPEGFTAVSAYGMKTNVDNKGAAEPVFLSPEGDSGFINLPASTIISVKFTK